MPDTVPEASGDCGAHHAAHPRLATSSELNGAQGTASTAAATAPTAAPATAAPAAAPAASPAAAGLTTKSSAVQPLT